MMPYYTYTQAPETEQPISLRFDRLAAARTFIDILCESATHPAPLLGWGRTNWHREVYVTVARRDEVGLALTRALRRGVRPEMVLPRGWTVHRDGTLTGPKLR